jgi:DNA modification methylase
MEKSRMLHTGSSASEKEISVRGAFHGNQETKDGFCILCGAWRGSFGLEPSLKMYVDHTVDILRELRRVLKPDGVLFWSIGDSYAGGGNYQGVKSESTLSAKQASNRGAKGVHQELGAVGKDSGSAKNKDLCLIPQRIAIAAQEDGWWVRSDIIWHKPNTMPESCKDRPTDAYEHILMLTKSSKYYWDKDAVSEPAKNAGKVVSLGPKSFSKGQSAGNDVPESGNSLNESYQVKQTRNLRNVWTFPTQPYRGDHFAAFPEELPRKCILAASKSGDLILDPFGGSGTTGQVARSLDRNAVLLDIAYKQGIYLELAEERIKSQIKEEKEKS